MDNNQSFNTPHTPVIRKGNIIREPDVSVIIPVFNTSKYLPEALQSVIDQTLINIEIICIDDGSTDDSLSVLRHYAEHDGRITVYEQNNNGLSNARNNGIAFSRGKYIFFFDSDDMFAKNDALEKAFFECENNDLEVLAFDAMVVSDENEEMDFIRNYEYPKVSLGIELFTLMRSHGEWYAPVWMQMYRRSFLEEHKIEFIEGIIHEDEPFSFEVMLCANRYGYLYDALYKYRRRTDSITSQKSSYIKVKSLFLAYHSMEKLYGKSKRNLNGYQRKECIALIKDISKEMKSNYFKLSYSERIDIDKSLNVSNMHLLRNVSNKPIKFTIVATFYNQEWAVERCVDSILKQTYKNLEIICVDDASTDDTFAILERYRCSYPSIRVIRMEQNMMTGITRKKGVEEAVGEYLLFVDGDDYLEPYACDVLFYEIQKHPVDIMQFGVNVIRTGNTSIIESKNMSKWLEPLCVPIYGKDVLKKCFLNNEYAFNLCAKVFRTSLIKLAYEHIEELKSPYGEDKYNYFIISDFAKSYYGIDVKLYNYAYGDGISGLQSITHDRFDLICRTGICVDAAERYAISRKDPILLKAIEQYRVGSLRDCIHKGQCFFEDGYGSAVEMMIRRFSPVLIATETLRAFYYNRSEMVTELKDTRCFTPKDTKIKSIATYFYRLHNGGTERVVANLTKIWSKMGYQVIILTDEAPSADDYDSEAVKRIVLPSSSESYGEKYLRRGEMLQKILIENRVDLVVYHAWVNPILMLDLLVCKLNGVRFAIHCHNVFSQYAIYDPILFSNLPYSFMLADGVITLNKMDTDYWCEFNNSVFQTINPINHNTIEEIPRSNQNRKTIIWSQRIVPDKHLEDALEVFRIVRSEVDDAKLVVLGRAEDSKYEKSIYRLARRLRISSSVSFVGYQKNVENYYSDADICVITSDYEGFPMGMIESMGAGVPVVMYELPYLTLVENGKGIVSIKNHDINEMARQIIALFNDDEKRKKIGNEARESIQELLKYDYQEKWKAFFDQLENGASKLKKMPMMWDTLLSHIRMGIERNVINTERESGDPYKINTMDARYQLMEIRKSKSYRLGHALTLVPRWIRHKLTGFPM